MSCNTLAQRIGEQETPLADILVVDDSSIVLMLVKDALEEQGWRVRTADCGEAACALIQRQAPAVVVCDLHMPDMSGFDVIRRLQDVAPDLPVIIHSGDDNVGAVLSAVRGGAFDYVLKATDNYGPLLAAVGRALEHTRVLRENRHLQAELAARLEDLTDARDRALTASRTKSSFLANMSHELRTPLNAILGYSEMLAEDLTNIDAEAVSDLGKIKNAGRHLLALINDILDLAKIEAGRATILPERVLLSDFLYSVAETALPLANRRDNNLVVDADPDLGEMVVDPRRLRQILINLLGNASKFTKNGTITLQAHRVESRVRIAVRDTGIGMTADQAARIFGAFAQAENDTTKRFGGTGLGLAISKQLAELMGSRIELETAVGWGSCFSIELPTDGVLPDTTYTPIISIRREKGDNRQTTVLVIDDDQSMLEIMRRMLASEGLRVLTASSGTEGLQLARAERPDVICLDIVMPGLDGYSVLRTLKSDPKLEDIPVVMVTMMDDEAGLAVGASAYLMKPVGREPLFAALRSLGLKESKGDVLVVDDCADQRELARRMLVAEGWRVREATNGREAMAQIGSNRPDLVLLDLMMPEVNGFAVIDQMQADASLQDIPVVVVTAAEIPPAQMSALRSKVERVIRMDGHSTDSVSTSILGMVRRLAGGTQNQVSY